MKITITGMPVSGKGTVGARLAEHFGLEFLSMGQMRRTFAADQGLTIEELNKKGETEDTDTKFDDWQKNYGESNDDFLMDSRLGFHFIPDSIKIFLDVSYDVAAKRLVGAAEERMGSGEVYKDVEAAKKSLMNRVASDIARYKRHYGIDPYSHGNYDIVLDTSTMTKEEVFDDLVYKINNFINK